MKSEMLEWIKDYFKNTPKAEIQKDWEEADNLNIKGTKAFEYIEFMQNTYRLPPGSSLKVPENLTPNFSGSFFLLILHHE